MQGSTYPEGALPAPVSRTPIVAALLALLVGGAIATGVWWLTDNDVNVLPEPATETKVIVAQPAAPGSGTAAKDEAKVAAAVGGTKMAVDPSTGFARYGTSQYRPAVTEPPMAEYPAYPTPSGPGAGAP
jgi:hypothetical protein